MAKPDPRVFQPALEALGATADDTVYVGDRAEIDGAAAAAAATRRNLTATACSCWPTSRPAWR